MNDTIVTVMTMVIKQIAAVLFCICAFVFCSSLNTSLAQTTSPIFIIVESRSSAHPEYIAAPPISVGSQVTVTAVGARANNNFEWSINGRAIDLYSGVGQDQITISVTDRPTTVEVVVTDATNQTIGSARTKITPEDLGIYIYQDHPLRGPLYQFSLQDQVLTTATSLSLRSVVYGAADSEPETTWSSNDGGELLGGSYLFSRPNEVGTQVITSSYEDNFLSRASRSLQVLFLN